MNFALCDKKMKCCLVTCKLHTITLLKCSLSTYMLYVLDQNVIFVSVMQKKDVNCEKFASYYICNMINMVIL